MKSEKTPIKTTVSILIGLTWFASQGVSLAQTMPTYQHIVIDPNPSVNGSDTLEKALADINGDGKLDAVLGEGKAHGGPGGLYWYEAPSSGNLSDPWIKHTITNSGNFYEDIAIFDVNGDGAPDIIASDNNQLVWFENPLGHGGNPATDPWPVHVIRAGGGTHVIALGDIDGDGKTDIICSSSGLLGSSGAILFQNTPDSWTELRFGTVGESVALLDIGSGMGRINIAGGDGKSVVWLFSSRDGQGHGAEDAGIPDRPHVAFIMNAKPPPSGVHVWRDDGNARQVRVSRTDAAFDRRQPVELNVGAHGLDLKSAKSMLSSMMSAAGRLGFASTLGAGFAGPCGSSQPTTRKTGVILGAVAVRKHLRSQLDDRIAGPAVVEERSL